jgi:hypothetical protein
VLSVLLRFTASDYHLGIFWSLCCLSFFGLQLLITTLVSFGHCVVCPSSVYSFYPSGDQKPSTEEGQTTQWPKDTQVVIRSRKPKKDRQHNDQKSFFGLQLLITTLVSFGHCVVCPSSVYGFWLPLGYLLVIVLSVLLRFTASDYHLGIFWSLCCLSFFGLQLLITTLVSFGHCVVCPSSVYWWSEAVNRRRTDNTMTKRYPGGNQKL